MKISMLISYGFVGVISYSLFFSEAYAEYYYVRDDRPAIHCIKTVTHCYTKHLHKHKYKPKYKYKHRYRQHCRHHYIPSCYNAYRNEPDISVYNMWNSFPPACSCGPCQTDYCTPCSPCAGSSVYYVPPSRSYILEYYDYNFGGMDFDRRTADDIGNDMNIDY